MGMFSCTRQGIVCIAVCLHPSVGEVVGEMLG